jgi:hypothetical protein
MITRATKIADAAAKLDRNGDHVEHALDRGGVHRLAGERAVEIDDVQIVETLRGEGARLRGRIVVEDGRLGHVAAQEADALAFFEIDRRIEDHGRHCRKLAIRAKPSV